MTYKTFRTWQGALTAAIAVIAAVSVVLGNFIILLAAVIIGMAVIYTLRRRVAELVDDERTYSIAHKAARLTVAVVGIGMAVIGGILLALSRHDLSSTRAQVGFTLEYATCALLIINYIAYYYYSRKLGGR
jgi:uncharacterized membrane protein